MNTTETRPADAGLAAIYDDVERAIVSDWLGLARPPALAALDINAGEDDTVDEDDGEDDADRPIRVNTDLYGHYNEHSLGNAVARLALARIQHRLPQWGCVHADGSVVLGRHAIHRKAADIELLPRFLFEINWADSGPGFSWPEAYHVTYLPGFHRHVVTASQDSPDMHGYSEQAIGHCGADEPLLDGCRRAIVAWWTGQARGWGQLRWEYLFRTGEVDAATAAAWAGQVWAEDGEPRGDL